MLDLRMTRAKAVGSLGVVGKELLPCHGFIPRKVEIGVLK
jgi:hypothetical protein